MTARRLILEGLLALALAWFAITVGEAYASATELAAIESAEVCQRGLPALAESEPHSNNGQSDDEIGASESTETCAPNRASGGADPVDWLMMMRR